MNTNIITHMVAEARPDTNREIRTYDACNRRRACCCENGVKDLVITTYELHSKAADCLSPPPCHQPKLVGV